MRISDWSSDVCSSDLSASEFISSAPSPFCEIVAAHAAEGDALCRISPVILAAMRSEGLFRTLQPRRFGGGEADIAALFAQQLEISATEMSTGWLAGVMGVLALQQIGRASCRECGR